MKRFFFVAAMSMLFAVVGCKKEPAPARQEPDAVKSSEAKISAFVVTVGTEEIKGKLFESEKVIEIPYLPYQLAGLASATAKVTISDKASISPDPAQAIDYTVKGGVKFTVTAEDGEKKAEYTVELAAALFQNKIEKTWEKTFGGLGLAKRIYDDCGAGFSGLNIVTPDCQVFDLDGKKIGTLNVEGVPGAGQEGFQLVALSNDTYGVLFASVVVTADGKPAINSNSVHHGSIYMWKDGWNKPATVVIDGSKDDEGKPTAYNFSKYFAVAGDVANGNYVLTNITPNRNNIQMHHCRTWTNGTMAWSAFNVAIPSNDGNWSQMVSPVSGSNKGAFIIGDSRGNNEGYRVLVRQGVADAGTDVELHGTVLDDELAEGGGKTQYGNFSFGHVRGFQYNGEDYVIASTTGWPSAYVTVQPTDPEKAYMLRTQVFNASQCNPSSAFVLDPATGTGHIVIFIGPAYEVIKYTITTEIQ